MANTIRFYDGYAYDGYNYNGRIVVHVDSFSYSGTDLNEVQVPVDVPAGPYAGKIFVLYFDLADPTDPTVVTGGFTFDSASPPAWVTTWTLLSNTYSQNPPWDLEPTRDVELFDGSWTSVDSGFAVSVDGASDPNWYQPPPPPVVTGFSPAAVWTGQTVAVTGSGFTGGTLTVGGHAPPTVTVVDDSTITFVADVWAGIIEVSTVNGFGDSATDLVLRPWVKQLAIDTDVAEGYAFAQSVFARLSDSASMLAYGPGPYGAGDPHDPGRVRTLGTGATSVTPSPTATFDADGGPGALIRLDDTHGLLLWGHSDPLGIDPGTVRLAVVTSHGTGSAPTVGAYYEITGSDPIPGGTFVGLSSSLVVSSNGCAINVAGGVVTSIDYFGTDPTWTGAGLDFGIRNMIRLSATSFLASDDTFSGSLDLTVVDLTGGVVTVSPTTSYTTSLTAEEGGWVLASGHVVQWMGGFDFLTVDPNGMLGPLVDALALGGNAAITGFNAGTPADFTDDETMIIQPVQGPAATLLIRTGPLSVDLITRVPPFDLSGVGVGVDVDGFTAGLDGRVLIVAPDATSGVAVALLLAPDLPRVTGWIVGAIG